MVIYEAHLDLTQGDEESLANIESVTFVIFNLVSWIVRSLEHLIKIHYGYDFRV